MGRKHSAKVFLELLEPIRHSLYAHARHMVWHENEAADVVQEAFMTGWREFGRFELGTNFRAWMFRILINMVYRSNKRTARRREVDLTEKVADVYATLEREEAWSCLLDRPETLTDLLDERLARSLGLLGPNERQCLLLRLLEGFTYKEIAHLLGIPIGTVMSYVHRARIRLREELAALAVERGLIKESA